MNAGVVVFSAKGFHATRVDDIVRRAKASHGTFYLYFSSKDELFEQLVAEVSAELETITRSLPEIRDDDAGRAALEEWLRAFHALYGRYGPLIRSWTDAEAPGGSAGLPDLLGSIAGALAERVRVRRSKQLRAEVAALACVAMVERLNYLLATDQVSSDVDQVADTLAAILLDAFFGPGH
jgi:AcrR family transcriptional regulator